MRPITKRWTTFVLTICVLLTITRSIAPIGQSQIQHSLTITSSGRVTVRMDGLPWLQTVGGDIVDEGGSPVLLKGVSIPASGDASWLRKGSHTYLGDFQTVQAWGGNLVRFSADDDWYDSARYEGPNMDQIVDWAEAAGIYLIIDIHHIFGGVSTQADLVNLWTAIATQYMDRSHVLFELLNEPGGVTMNGWTFQQWRTAAQACVDAIRGLGAENLIVIDGWNWASMMTQWIDNYLTGTNLVYSFHLYKGAYGHNPPSDLAGMEAEWRTRGFLHCVENDIAPALYGEFNMRHNDPSDPSYPDPATAADQLTWFDNALTLCEQQGISYTAWCFVPGPDTAIGWGHEYLLSSTDPTFQTPSPTGEILINHMGS